MSKWRAADDDDDDDNDNHHARAKKIFHRENICSEIDRR